MKYICYRHHLTHIPKYGCDDLEIFGSCQVEESPGTQQNHCDGLRMLRGKGRGEGRGGEREGKGEERGEGREGKGEERGEGREGGGEGRGKGREQVLCDWE